MSQAIKAWISASRPRTLPLAAASILMGGFLASFNGVFRWSIFLLTLSTTLLLQILSNLANDFGDFQHGADHRGRVGPSRMVQSGAISPGKMKKVIMGVALITLVLGIYLLTESVGITRPSFYLLLALGILSIAAAVKYTAGNKPYGYSGWGDLSVVIFFGLVAVLGTYFLQTSTIQWDLLLPALSCGLFATAVLNVNNIRDIESDAQAGKLSIPVRIGRDRAVLYHWFLLGAGIAFSVVYIVLHYISPWQWLFLAVLPLLYRNGQAVSTKTGKALDPYLKQMALTTLAYVITFGVGLLVA